MVLQQFGDALQPHGVRNSSKQIFGNLLEFALTLPQSRTNFLAQRTDLPLAAVGDHVPRNCHKITFASRIVFTYSGRVSEPAAIKRRYEALRGVLDERSRRLLVAAESLALGRGGISAVARATGVSRQVIARGRQELTEPAGPPPGRIRRRGGGRKRSVTKDPTLKSELERLVEPLTRGDPESPLRWTLKSVRKLAAELERRGHPTSHRMVAELLHQLGYRLQANRKTKEGTKHPDRNAQFEQINRKVKRFLAHRQPAISVDTKKRELVGDFKNNGRELRPKGDPEKVRVHDFSDSRTGPGHALRGL